MDYTLDNVHNKLKQFADKMGSDYFPLPVILNFFETATLDFVGHRLRTFEKTQEVTDDIRSLVSPKNLSIIIDSNDSLRFICAIPVNYLRLLRQHVIYNDGTRDRKSEVLRQAEYDLALLNPSKTPTKQYPLILQEANLFQVNSGPGVIPFILKIIYCKKPTFATTGQPGTRIVNLPDDAIEKVLLSTIKLLFNKTADERQPTAAEIENSYRKIFR